MEQPKGDACFLMTIRYVSRFRSGFTVSICAILFSLVSLRDFKHYAFAWMDSGFYRPIIKLASVHLLDCELGERSSRLECCRKLQDRKSTRLNSSHANISYAVFCLKKEL